MLLQLAARHMRLHLDVLQDLRLFTTGIHNKQQEAMLCHKQEVAANQFDKQVSLTTATTRSKDACKQCRSTNTSPSIPQRQQPLTRLSLAHDLRLQLLVARHSSRLLDGF
jgi:hypothetical protein